MPVSEHVAALGGLVEKLEKRADRFGKSHDRLCAMGIQNAVSHGLVCNELRAQAKEVRNLLEQGGAK
jgi:hypothetical protein